MTVRLGLAFSFARRLCSIAVIGALATAFVACDADGELDFGPDASTSDEVEPAPGGDAGWADEAAMSKALTLCGNKVIDPGEECDDGNIVDNDGCSSTCKIESAGTQDVCDGALLALSKADASTRYTGSVSGTTTGLFNHYAATCGGGTGRDAVYRIEPPLNGRATVRLKAAFSAVLFARTGCTDAKTELACADDSHATADTTASLTFPVFQGAPVFVFVDGYGGSAGEFTLDVDVETAVCGNGKAEWPEECDDGNTNDGDGCSSTCTLDDATSPSACPGMRYRLGATPSNPGVVSFAGDTSTLSHGGGNASGCVSNGSGPNAVYAITPTVTGSLSLALLANYPTALLHVRRECAESTTQIACSGVTDALVPATTNIPVVAEQMVYVYVDSGAIDAKGRYTLDAKLTAAACGNGVVDGDEECDDGNTNDGDGCSSMCFVDRNP